MAGAFERQHEVGAKTDQWRQVYKNALVSSRLAFPSIMTIVFPREGFGCRVRSIYSVSAL